MSRADVAPKCSPLLLAVLAALAAGCSRPPPPAAENDFALATSAALEQLLPMSAEATTGQLANGLRYFIRENSEPANRAYLRLVVDAGSVLEADDQRGVAHFLEHMAFNGTERFPKDELVEFMQSIGMPLGAGVNASTSFDQTVFSLTVPTDQPEHMATAFEILEDWAHALALDPGEIEQERDVVLEEWRSGRGVGARVTDRHLPVLLNGSRYAERLPIGTEASIEGISRDHLLGFYRTWYRPELMSVVAVGDFDGADIERLVRRHFEGLPRSAADAPARGVYDVPGREGTAYSIAADPEQTAASVELMHQLPPDRDWTVGGYRRRLVEALYNNLLNLRLQEIAREPDAPFISASSSTTQPIRTGNWYRLAAPVLETNIERGLTALLTESARVAKFGFTDTELARAKTQFLRAMERSYATRDARTSPAFAQQYVDAFLLDRGVWSIDYDRALYERFVPAITLEEVNAVGRGWLEGSSRVVLVTAPQKDGLDVPDAAALEAVIAAAAGAEVTPYVDEPSVTQLLDELPSSSMVVAERTRGGGVTEWDLANGIRVVLKPTDFNKDEVLFRGLLSGGGSLVPDEDLVVAQTAAQVLAAGGLGDLDVTALQKAMTGKVAVAGVGISENEVGVNGQASVKDLQTLFELIYLRFTAPRADPDAFAAVQNRMRSGLANRDANPAVVFNDAFTRIMTQGHPRSRPLTIDSLGQMSLERSLATYRELFANARGATFVFVGAFELEAIKPLVELYLGGLPTAANPQTWRDHGIRPPDGVVAETVRKGVEPRAQTRIAFHGPIDMHDLRNPTTFSAMGAVLQNQLREALREDLGGTYGVGVRTAMGWIPVEQYTLIVEFTSDPARADALAERIFAEIAALKAGPPADKVADVRTAMSRGFETNQRQNGWWLTGLSATYQFEPEIGPDNLLAFGRVVEGMTPETIRDAARQYIDTERYVRVTLLPETAPASN